MLNAAQQKAVETTEGPVRIIAGAGTGKTATLVARIVHLVESGKAQAREILALTFTHKAAHELNERLKAQGLPRVMATTFHGFAASVLRATPSGGRADFSILTQDQQEEILRDLLYSQERDELANVVTDFNRVREAAACGAEWPALLSSVSIERLGELWHSYRAVLAAKNAVDFTGLLTGVLELWKEQPEILAVHAARFRYVMVDEYQDVSEIQVEMVKRLVNGGKSHLGGPNICVVGDPDQTIYSWRGAHPRALDDFATHFPSTQTITLTQNYRNPASILDPAERLIAHNPDRLPKTLEATRPATLPVHLWEARDEWQLHEMVLHLLEQFLGSHDHMARADVLDGPQKNRKGSEFLALGEIAILYRTQAEGRFLAAQLSKHSYPFEMSVLTEFWQRKEIQKFLEKLHAIRSVEDRRRKIEVGMQTEGQGKNPEDFFLFSDWLRPHLEQFVWNQSIPDNKAGPLLHLLSYAMAYDHFPLPEALSHFLDAAATAQDADHLVASDKIHLLTLHAAKGLEFPIVLILGLEEGTLPHRRNLDPTAADDPSGLAEERRLLYVGMTRAREQLHLFTARVRDSKPLEPSRFLSELGTEYLTHGQLPEHRALASRRKQVKKAQMSLF